MRPSADASMGSVVILQTTPLVVGVYGARFTTPIDGTQIKVMAWDHSGVGLANRLVELAERVLAPVPSAV
jgi:hypothetical protein